MHIQGINHQQAWQRLKTRQESPQAATEKAPKLQNTAAPAPIETETKAAELNPEQVQEKGVIRLLSEGHFQGVAGLRLLINFHEELQQTASREAQEALISGGQELVTTLNGSIEEMGEIFDFEVAAPMKDFKEMTSSLFSGATDPPFDADTVIKTMTDASIGLFSALNENKPAAEQEKSAMETTEGEVSATAESAIAGVDTPATDPLTEGSSSATPDTSIFLDALGNLQQWFNTEMAALETKLAATQSLPELSSQRGKGVAYERFLAIYNSLQTPTGSAGDETGGNQPESGIQTEA
jgi:hypothetical protein